jgi:transposase-like protein
VRRGREYWSQLVKEIESGERVAEVARRNRVQAKTLSWWRWKLGGSRTRARRAINTRLLPVVVSEAQTRVDTIIELRVRDVVVRIAGGSDVRYVAALVDALRG